MNQVKAYKILEESGFTRDNAEGLVEAFNENENLVTKGDLREGLKDLEIRILKEINAQTWKFLGGMAFLGLIFKLADLFIHLPK